LSPQPDTQSARERERLQARRERRRGGSAQERGARCDARGGVRAMAARGWRRARKMLMLDDADFAR